MDPNASHPYHTPGPTGPHALSLWNFSSSPGWTDEEARRLRLCLMAYGVGRWSQIAQSGHLPGKTISQLNLQTQRVLGQQSLAEFTGLRVDPAEVFVGNRERIERGARTKMGIVVNDGPNPSREVVMRRLRENRARFELAPERVHQAEAELCALARAQQLQEAAAALHRLPADIQTRTHQALEQQWRAAVDTSDGSPARPQWVQRTKSGLVQLAPLPERQRMDDTAKQQYRRELQHMLQALQAAPQKLLPMDKENASEGGVVARDGDSNVGKRPRLERNECATPAT